MAIVVGFGIIFFGLMIGLAMHASGSTSSLHSASTYRRFVRGNVDIFTGRISGREALVRADGAPGHAGAGRDGDRAGVCDRALTKVSLLPERLSSDEVRLRNCPGPFGPGFSWSNETVASAAWTCTPGPQSRKRPTGWPGYSRTGCRYCCLPCWPDPRSVAALSTSVLLPPFMSAANVGAVPRTNANAAAAAKRLLRIVWSPASFMPCSRSLPRKPKRHPTASLSSEPGARFLLEIQVWPILSSEREEAPDLSDWAHLRRLGLPALPQRPIWCQILALRPHVVRHRRERWVTPDGARYRLMPSDRTGHRRLGTAKLLRSRGARPIAGMS